MSYEIIRDLPAIRFVRCLRALPGHAAYATGAGFTIGEATARCESEWVERGYELSELRPLGIRPAGIAAHPNRVHAQRAAFVEASESFMVEQLARERLLMGLPVFSRTGFRWWAARTSVGYFSLILTEINGVPFAAHSAGVSLAHTLLKTWEEYRNPMSLRPTNDDLSRYSKLALEMGVANLEKIRFQLSTRRYECPKFSDYDVRHVQRGRHYVVYLTSRVMWKGKGDA
ncbi:MAG: hypothetical protein JST16_01830 [Bdellovibrionales bacterium]|nr:hypothetical protein [Bdellovibrionales bacterium]